jgi:N-acetylglucosamine malate deacetylase 1
VGKTVLVIGAHPDDEVLGCGGTIARHAEEGDSVHVMILSEGLTARDIQRDRARQKKGLRLIGKQAAAAAALLGVTSIKLSAFPDNRMDGVDLLDVVKVIEKEAARIRPDVVYTHHWGDLNVDHRIVSDAVVTAFRPGMGPANAVYAFEIPSSSEWSFGTKGAPFMPNHFVDITRTVDKKLQAMGLYTSELREYPHPRSQEAVRALAMRRGSQAGLDMAEGFQLVRSMV